MFNDKYGLTQAVLEGRKTMTRRIVSIPNTWHGVDVCAIGPDTDKRSLLLYDADEFLIEDCNTGLCGQVMPLYKVGEIVAVAQRYSQIFTETDLSKRKGSLGDMITCKGWDNKMFVQAAVMPHRIRITDVRVERLQDISDEDCLREGIKKLTFDTYTFDGWKFFSHNPREAFAALIDKVSGKGTWASNPLVYAYEFELVK